MRQLTVLLVEDNPRDVRLTQRAFKQAGLPHELRVVRDGDEALAMTFCPSLKINMQVIVFIGISGSWRGGLGAKSLSPSESGSAKSVLIGA